MVGFKVFLENFVKNLFDFHKFSWSNRVDVWSPAATGAEPVATGAESGAEPVNIARINFETHQILRIVELLTFT